MGSLTARAEREMTVGTTEVATAILDMKSWDQWFDLHGGWPDGTPAAPTPGTRFRERVVVFGIGDDVTWHPLEARLPGRLVLEGTGTFGSTVTLRFDLKETPTTLLGCELEVRGRWVVPAPLRRTLERMVAAEMDRYLTKLDLHLRQRAGQVLSPDEQHVFSSVPERPKFLDVATRLLGIDGSAAS